MQRLLGDLVDCGAVASQCEAVHWQVNLQHDIIEMPGKEAASKDAAKLVASLPCTLRTPISVVDGWLNANWMHVVRPDCSLVCNGPVQLPR